MYTAPYPGLHLTVGVIEDAKPVSHSFALLRDIAANCPPFSVHIKGERCFGDPFLSVGVNVTSQRLAYLAGEVEGAVTQSGLTPRTFNRWNFHISLLHPQFARRTWTAAEFREACLLVRRYAPEGSCRIKGLELWEPDFPPLKIIEQFPLNHKQAKRHLLRM